MKRWMRILGWTVVGLSAIFFLLSGIQKLAGAEQMIHKFNELRYPDWSRIVIGWVEIAGAILLVWPRLTLCAAIVLGILMVGAVASEMLAGQGFGALLAGQWLILLALIAAARFRFVVHSKSRRGIGYD